MPDLTDRAREVEHTLIVRVVRELEDHASRAPRLSSRTPGIEPNHSSGAPSTSTRTSLRARDARSSSIEPSVTIRPCDDHRDPVAHPLHQLQLVAGEHDRHTPRPPFSLQDLDEDVGADRIESARTARPGRGRPAGAPTPRPAARVAGCRATGSRPGPSIEEPRRGSRGSPEPGSARLHGRRRAAAPGTRAARAHASSGRAPAPRGCSRTSVEPPRPRRGPAT